MKMKSAIPIACLFLFISRVSLAEGQESQPKKTVTIQGQVVDLEKGQEELISMLKSDDPKRREAALDVLRRKVGLFVDNHYQMVAELSSALSECYQRFPPFPAGTQISKTNVREITGSSKVFAFCILVQYGGKQGRAIMDAALQGEDPIMKVIAQKEKQLIADDEAMRIKNARDADGAHPTVTGPKDEPVANLPDRMTQAIVHQSSADKKAVLHEINTRWKELRKSENKQVREPLVSVLKTQLLSEKNADIIEEMLVVIGALEDRETAISYLNALIENPQTPRFLKADALQVRNAVEHNAFR